MCMVALCLHHGPSGYCCCMLLLSCSTCKTSAFFLLKVLFSLCFLIYLTRIVWPNLLKNVKISASEAGSVSICTNLMPWKLCSVYLCDLNLTEGPRTMLRRKLGEWT